MPYPVKHLIEGRPLAVTIKRDETASKALNLMVKHDFSQLPVVDSDNHPVGMVTHEGILRAVSNFKAQLNDLHVRDVMMDVSKSELFDLEDDLFGLLAQLKMKNAALIIDQQHTLVGIVTTYDSTEYFRNRAEDLMRVEDIESAVKDFILLAYTRNDGTRDEEQLAQAILRVTPKGETESKQQKTFDELTLNQYISLLTSKHTWSVFDSLFKVPRDYIIRLLEDIRNIRNELAHFRKEITAGQTDQLRFCAEWFARCWEEFQQSKSNQLFQPLPDAFGRPAKLQVAEVDAGAEYKAAEAAENGELKQAQAQVQVIAEETRPRESRYASIADWLQSQPGRIDTVKLSFEEIEEIIGSPLPASAYEHRAWWANDSQRHPHSQLWLEVGWRTNYLNRTEKVVTFVRIRDREKAYIEFFSKLLAELQNKADFSVRQGSSDGSNWVVCQTISSPGYIVGQFNYSFARGRRFRVELYIDTYDQQTTKQVFDNLHSKRAEFESVLGELSWERIDDKRASRIAMYHPGHITDDDETLTALREWAVDKMIALYNTLEPITSKVFKEILKP